MHYPPLDRYPSVPPLPADCRDVVLAFDFMRLTFADCLWAHHMNEVLAIAFPPEVQNGHDDDMGEEEGQLLSVPSTTAQQGKVPKESKKRQVKGALLEE